MIRYCPESHRMWDGDNDLNRQGRYLFNFTPSGFFTLLNRRGEPLYHKAFPLFTKATSHLIWCCLWAIFYFGLTFFTSINPTYLLIFIALLILHALLFTLRTVQLVGMGGLKPLIRPPYWIKVTRQLQQGKGLDYLKEEHLEKHPGLLANLTLIEAVRGHREKSHEAVLLALALCPDHVALKALYQHLLSKQFVL